MAEPWEEPLERLYELEWRRRNQYAKAWHNLDDLTRAKFRREVSPGYLRAKEAATARVLLHAMQLGEEERKQWEKEDRAGRLRAVRDPDDEDVPPGLG